MRWVLIVCVSALLGGLSLAYGFVRIEIDHAECFRALAGLADGEVFAVIVAFPWLIVALGSLHFLPYLIGTFTFRKSERAVWGAGSLALLIACSFILLSDTSRHHDCDRKGLEFDALFAVLVFPLLANLMIVLICLSVNWWVSRSKSHRSEQKN